MSFKKSIINVLKRDPANGREVSIFQLYLMRGLYLLTFLALGYSSWSEILKPSETWGAYDGVAYSFWAAYATIMGLGIRFPLKMLPLLLLQLFYKSVWLIGIAYPMWSAGALDITSEGLLKPFLAAIPIDFMVIPWLYVWKYYIRAIFRFQRIQRTRSVN